MEQKKTKHTHTISGTKQHQARTKTYNKQAGQATNRRTHTHTVQVLFGRARTEKRVGKSESHAQPVLHIKFSHKNTFHVRFRSHCVCACVRLGCNLSDGDGSNSLKIVDMYRLCLEWEQEGQGERESE